MNCFGMDPISLQYCWIAGSMSWDRSLSGKIALYLVALSMIYRAYLVCPWAVADPCKMPMWTVSPKLVGSAMGVALRLDLSMVDISPRSVMGSWSYVDIEKLGWLVSLICFMMLETLRNPNLL